MHDQDIVRRVIAGDQFAMKALIVKYQHLVINTCYRILSNAADAEDIAQEVFIEAYRSISSLKNEDALSYWLYRIALNKSVNHQKKHRFFNRFLRIDHLLPGQECAYSSRMASSDRDSLQEMIHAEKINLFKDVLGRLPSRQQKAFVLHYFEQLSYKEIACVLELSVSSVESLIFRAKRNIKKKYGHLFSEFCE